METNSFRFKCDGLRFGFYWWLVGCLFIMVMFLGCGGSASSSHSFEPTYSRAENAVRRNPEDYIAIRKEYSANELFGGIKNGLLSVENNSNFTFDRVVVKVYYIKTDGGVHKSAIVVFRNIQGNATVHEPFPNSERGTSIKTKIQSITCNELGIHQNYIVE